LPRTRRTRPRFSLRKPAPPRAIIRALQAVLTAMLESSAGQSLPAAGQFHSLPRAFSHSSPRPPSRTPLRSRRRSG
jgi:hypothetical protein